MTLIACPECGKEISDKVQACPHCGYPLATEGKLNVPAMPDTVSRKSQIGKIIAGLIVIALLVIVVVYGIGVQQEKAYIEKLELASSTMLLGASTSENTLDLIGTIWYNAIYEENDTATDQYTKPRGFFVDDFNIALMNYFTSDPYLSASSVIETNKSDVQVLMQEVQNPPKKLQNSYETITELFVAYQSLTNFALNPTGNLTSFSDEKREKLNKFTELFSKLDAQTPD